MGFHKKRANNVKTFTNHLLEFFEFPVIIYPGFMIKPMASQCKENLKNWLNLWGLWRKATGQINRNWINSWGFLWYACFSEVSIMLPSWWWHSPVLPAPWFSRVYGDMRRPKSNSGWYVIGRPASRHKKAPSPMDVVFECSFSTNQITSLNDWSFLNLKFWVMLTCNMDRENEHSPTGNMFQDSLGTMDCPTSGWNTW